jgi:undecaprenyl diphosphate synthase
MSTTLPIDPAAAALPVEPAASRLPRHVAIIMDGNGRWAERRGKPRSYGHRVGARAVRATVEHCLRRGIPHLTLFAFSSENWARPAGEVNALMSLFLKALDREVDQLGRHGVRIDFIGDLSAFSEPLQARMRHAVALTRGNSAIRVNVAVNYGGRWDLAAACRRLAEKATRGEIDPKTIDVATVAAEMALADQPEPDLFIRSGGDQRISNFLLWQLAYTELVFIDTLWPDFSAADLDRAFAEYAARERRFGMTGDQVRAASGAAS